MTETTTPGIRTETRDRIAILTIDNPARRNAIARTLRQELHRALKAALENEDIAAIILTGAGDHFCAGADISEMRERTLPESRELHIESSLPILQMTAGRKPVIAAVEGAAFGGGLSLVCAADFVVASRTARFCAAFMKIGLLPDIGILWTFPQKVGRAKATELLSLATEFDAEEAHRMGLVSQVTDAGKALEDALTLATALLNNPPVSIALIKSALTSFNHSLDQSLNIEIEYQSVLRATADHKEAVNAFLEKRPPRFSAQ